MIDNSILQKYEDQEFSRIQIISYAAALAVLLWGVAMNFFGDEKDVIWVRALAVFTLLLIPSFFKKYSKTKKTNSLFVFCIGFVVLAQGVYVSDLESWSSSYVLSVMLTLVAVTVYLTDRKLLNIWIILFALITIYIAYRSEVLRDSVYMLILGGAFMVGAYLASYGRSDSLNQLILLESRNRRILESITEGLMVLDQNKEILLSNPSADKIFSNKLKDLIVKSAESTGVAAYFENGETFTFENIFDEVLGKNKTVKGELISFLNPNGGTIWVSINADVYNLENKQKGILFTFQDVTSLKEKEVMVRDQERVLASNARFTALGEMAAGIAHEINNPLAIISGRTEQLNKLLSKIDGATAEQKELAKNYLIKINDTVQRVTKIISSMKSLAREGGQDPFDEVLLRTIVEDTLLVTSEKLKQQNIEMILKIPDDLKLYCRPAQISQVLMNLIHNAHDAIQSKKENRLEKEWIQIEAQTMGTAVEIIVSDSGPGIPEKIRSQIMNPFFTTKEPGKGTGLGLSITAKILKDHSGLLTLDENSQNTRFIIIVPGAA